jgi:hypothetical protein
LTKEEMQMSCELHVLAISPMKTEPSVLSGKEVLVDTETGTGTAERRSSTSARNRTVII